jgi:hypothetical protein
MKTSFSSFCSVADIASDNMIEPLGWCLIYGYCSPVKKRLLCWGVLQNPLFTASAPRRRTIVFVYTFSVAVLLPFLKEFLHEHEPRHHF